MPRRPRGTTHRVRGGAAEYPLKARVRERDARYRRPRDGGLGRGVCRDDRLRPERPHLVLESHDPERKPLNHVVHRSRQLEHRRELPLREVELLLEAVVVLVQVLELRLLPARHAALHSRHPRVAAPSPAAVRKRQHQIAHRTASPLGLGIRIAGFAWGLLRVVANLASERLRPGERCGLGTEGAVRCCRKFPNGAHRRVLRPSFASSEFLDSAHVRLIG